MTTTMKNGAREQTHMPWWEPPTARPKDAVLSPRWLADWLGDWADIDPAPHRQQIVQARVHWYLHDGLRDRWPARRIFNNPPWSQALAWVEQAADCVARGGSVVQLLPGDETTRYADLAIETAARHGGWAAKTRHRIVYGRPCSTGAPVFDLIVERSGGLLWAAGPAIPPPPREHVRTFDLQQQLVVVPIVQAAADVIPIDRRTLPLLFFDDDRRRALSTIAARGED